MIGGVGVSVVTIQVAPAARHMRDACGGVTSKVMRVAYFVLPSDAKKIRHPVFIAHTNFVGIEEFVRWKRCILER